MEPNIIEAREKQQAWRNWKTFGVKIKHKDVPVLNQRLKLYGYDTLTELTKDFILGKFPVITEDRQIQAIESNIQSNGLKTAMVVNEQFEPSFYKYTDLDDMLNYLLNIRKLQKHYASSLVSYFHRHRDTFFGPDPVQILQLTPHRRMWILQAMRQFGNYYNYKTNNPECKELIEKIITRFGLNVGMDVQHRVYIVDDNFVAEKIKLLTAIPGDVGFTIRVGLYSGLREDELVYCYSMEICNQGGCSCNKLHVVNKSNGMTVVVINWFRGHKKCYFTIMPTKIWQQFRSLHAFSDIDIETAHKICKRNANVKFMDLRKIHYNVMCRVMEMNEADILVGRAKSVAAKHYAMYEIDKMAERYAEGWGKATVGATRPV
jgi:intergrase/recombinase